MSVVLVSGGFDPLHDGHLDLLQEARQYGRVTVALNSDAWLLKKKGWIFMPWSARARILSALNVVYEVLSFDDSDGTVCEVLRTLRPDIFANGGDRITANMSEHAICAELHIRELFGVGGKKVRSSSSLKEEWFKG